MMAWIPEPPVQHSLSFSICWCLCETFVMSFREKLATVLQTHIAIRQALPPCRCTHVGPKPSPVPLYSRSRHRRPWRRWRRARRAAAAGWWWASESWWVRSAAAPADRRSRSWPAAGTARTGSAARTSAVCTCTSWWSCSEEGGGGELTEDPAARPSAAYCHTVPPLTHRQLSPNGVFFGSLEVMWGQKRISPVTFEKNR